MQNFPYILGQLLKISDELHAQYCKVVRGNDFPTQLAGASLYITASEKPMNALMQLAQRMHPYLSWAKSYRYKNEQYSGLVGWYCSLYEKTATMLENAWTSQTRFCDEEKAQLFIGYLADFPKKESNNENDETENGGNLS